MNRYKILLMALPAFAALPLTQAQEAETSNEGGFSGIEEVIVTARHREEGAQDVPIPISALSGEALANRSSTDLSDLTRIVPNLAFGESPTNSASSMIFLRGIGQVNWQPVQDPKVGIYLDSAYLARAQGGVFDLVDIERIEVLRGPQGTLFGRNTTAGLVHVVTKQPTDNFTGQVKVSTGNDGQKSASGVLNLPLGNTLAARFSAQHLESDGYVKNRSSGEDWNDENSQIFRANLLFNPTDTLEASLKFDYQRARERSSLGSCIWTGPDQSPALLAAPGLIPFAYIFNVYNDIRTACENTRPYSSTENDPSGKSNLDAWGINLTINADLSDNLALTSIASYRSTKDFNGSWGQGTDATGTPSYLEILGVGDNEHEQYSYEIRLAGDHNRIHWQIGAYAFEETGDNEIDVPVFRGVAPPNPDVWPTWSLPLPPAVEALLAPSLAALGLPSTFGSFALLTQFGGNRRQVVEAENSSYAVFGEAVLSFTEKLSLTAGLRYTKDERAFTRAQMLASGVLDPALTCPDAIAPVNGTTCNRSKSFDEFTPRVILSFQPKDNLLLYGGWSRGYSSGGFNQDVRMRPYDPEISGNWEAGLKSDWLNNHVIFNLTGFYNAYENQQITVGRFVNGQTTADLINAQEASLWGVEGELQLNNNNFFAALTFGWIDGEYDKFTIIDSVPTGVGTQTMDVERDLKDTETIRGSPYTLSLNLGTRFNFDGRSLLTAQAGYSYRGRIFNTLETLNTSRQAAYGLLDARISWAFSHNSGAVTAVALKGTNLLDKQYFTGALDFSGGAAPLHYVTRYWGEPRRFGVEVSHSFRGY